jgi:putative endonuclease
MPFVYILQSERTRKFYIGCADEVSTRLEQHQRGQAISTRGRGPWILVYQEQFKALPEARRRERQLKSWKSPRSIQKLIQGSKLAEGVPTCREGRRFDPD